MKIPKWMKALLSVAVVFVALSAFSLRANAAGIDARQKAPPAQLTPTQAAQETDDDALLGTITSLPEKLLAMLTGGATQLAELLMDGIFVWIVRQLLSAMEIAFSVISDTSANLFRYSWFQVVAGLFERFGLLLFAIGTVLAFVDAGVEYRRRGIDLSGTMLNFGKGLLAVGLFATAPVPLYNYCMDVQSYIMQAIGGSWSFDTVYAEISANLTAHSLIAVYLIVMLVLIFLIFLDCLARGGVLLVQICIGSFYMLGVPRGYLDPFYGWCKQVIALCVTTLLQNLLMFCGLAIMAENLTLGLGTMFAAKEVPKICAQFGLDTSAKASFSSMAVGANAAVQAVKTVATLAA